MPPQRIRASRGLLLPGDQPPLTHLGATLMRHLVGAGLRYSFYQLGLEPPESPPVRIHRLRLHLDGSALGKLLSPHPAAGELLGALLDPGGTASRSLPLRLRAAMFFHRGRLKVQRPPGPWHPPRIRTGDTGFKGFRDILSAWVPRLGDAFLAEIIAVLDRRQARRRGTKVAPAMSREAGRFAAGSKTRLSFLGSPDLLTGSWAETGAPPVPVHFCDAVPGAAGSEPHPLRGRFREHYRRCLDSLRPPYLSLADRAAARGLLAERDDAFFVPLDLAADLESDSRPSWLEPAVAANRLEYQSELSKPPAPEVLRANSGEPTPDVVQLGGAVPDWFLAPLAPLP